MKKFSATVWAKEGEFGIRPIGSVEEAHIFLEGWPAMERGPLYYVAANSIESAKAGSVSPDDAKEELAGFLDDVGALGEDRFAT